MKELEQTLVLLKPDAVQRALIGRILSRFEDVGLKIIGTKLVWADKAFARKHYREELAARRGERVRELMVQMLTEGPVLAFVLEGVSAIETVRKMIGATEPRAALPGTIRGDFAHVSYDYANKKDIGVKNLIHASADAEDAALEVPLWFKPAELHSYKSIHDVHTLA